jgi:acetyl/propionyl-CoA carboxylase alpha subunit/acetyl-CoA carboxylase carboxyltransferase component
MGIAKLLIANRGEIAIRIARTAADMGIETVVVHSTDDAAALHVRAGDAAVALDGAGPAAYLDQQAIIAAAKSAGADAIHPGYGFLSENAEFAAAVVSAGLTFVGPKADAIARFGDKGAARTLAEAAGVPIAPGLPAPVTEADALAFLNEMGPGGAIMLKAAAGGGGRGMRPVSNAADLPDAFARSQAEAEAAFGDGRLYAEKFFQTARHIEVQVAGDSAGNAAHIWERECSLQRQRQKIIEIAPAPALASGVRTRLLDAAVALAKAAELDSLSTIEFLVDAKTAADDDNAEIAFIEANARLQVEHTVTEAVTGLDLVEIQLRLAEGASLAEVGLSVPPPVQGMALQARINMETMTASGDARPAGGRFTAFEPPAGAGVRVDHAGYAGLSPSPRFDSLIAKMIVHARSGVFADVAAKAARALAGFRIEGVPTNTRFLEALLADKAVTTCAFDTRFIEAHAERLLGVEPPPRRFVEAAPASGSQAGLAGSKIDASDPLAVLNFGKQDQAAEAAAPLDAPDGTNVLAAPMQGAVVSLALAAGETVRAGTTILVMDAMKMQHDIRADVSGIIRAFAVNEGDVVLEGAPLAYIEPAEVTADDADQGEAVDLDAIRSDLAEVIARQANTLDENRPEAVAKRRKTKQRTARENIEDLVDPGSFTEYGSLVVAARRARMSREELWKRTPADGLVTGLARVNGDLFGDAEARCMVMSYDYTVLAGTQGKKNHEKKDRMFELAEKWRLPTILFAEGGGGRPGDTDVVFSANLTTPAFHLFGKLSGLAPMIGIASGRCFAGNAVLVGCCDVMIATENANIGMGGPAMIEGGGLGVFRPEDVGPMNEQTANGVVDILVKDEAEAVAVAKKYLSYFQGPVQEWKAADQRKLRHIVPENRVKVYDIREAIDLIADEGSVLELRAAFGRAMITSFCRIEGRPVGLIANNPMHIGGAIDADAADKAARFMQLCDAYDIPMLFLCDTPGNMVGPDYERLALVRHCCRPFVISANMTVPLFTVVLRKAYGLGAQGMAGGGFHTPNFAVGWPTAEFGGMGLEGAVKLGYRNELAAIEDPEERRRVYEEKVAGMYDQGKALTAAELFELDNVIDPADTRRWIIEGLRSAPPPLPREGKKHAWVDTW